MDGAHYNFVNKMYRRFGLEMHPGFCIIDVVPMLASGGFYPPDKIMINDIQTGPIAHTIYHESSHFLHPYARRNWWKIHMAKNLRPSDEEYALAELIADLGALVFIKENHPAHDIESYIGERDKDSIQVIARDLLSYPNILEKIANAGFEEARQIVASLTKKELKW